MKTQAGFTLIELLVSLTLLGLLFVLLLGGLRFGTRAWERNAATADAVDGMRSVQTLLRGAIERACPRQIGSTAKPQLDFAGDTDQLRLLAPAPRAMGGANCARLTFRVRPDGSQWRLALDINDGETDLLRHAQQITFSYLSAAGWQDGWGGQAELPRLVRLRVTFAKGDARSWPELFIAPRISADLDCTYDPVTTSCRGP